MEDSRWYLLRTKQYKEAIVWQRLSGTVKDVFLPLLKIRRKSGGESAARLVPLFPGYLFACFNLGLDRYTVEHTIGVVNLVSAGCEPSEVDAHIVDDIRNRGIVELPVERFCEGQWVQVIDGPMRGVDAIFERYLPGAERIAILFETIGFTGVRIILSPSRVTSSARNHEHLGNAPAPSDWPHPPRR